MDSSVQQPQQLGTVEISMTAVVMMSNSGDIARNRVAMKEANLLPVVDGRRRMTKVKNMGWVGVSVNQQFAVHRCSKTI